MSDNSAGSPANTQPGPEVAVPDQAEQSPISINAAASSEEGPDKTASEVNEGLPPATQVQSDVVTSQAESMTAPSAETAQQVAVRPRIGDSRPAARPPAQPEPGPPPVAAAPVTDGVGLRTPAKSRPPGQGQRRPSRAKQAVPEAAEPKGPGSKAPVRTADLDGSSADDDLENGAGESALSASATKGRRRSGRERRGKAVGRYLMCVHVRPHATQIAVLEGRTLVEHFVSRASDDTSQIDGNIYLGRVQNVLPGMEAAFVDIATPKNAVLYRGDVRYDLEDIETRSSSALRIEQMLKPGQMIVCQVTKNPIGAKGARLTQGVSLPGRFVVMVPNSSAFGISKRLEDPERRRLRRIVDEIRPEGHGLIVRTAARGASLDELRHDVARLSAQWAVIESEASRTTTPKLLYREPDLGVRIVREELNNDYRAVIIDDPDLYQQVRDYVAGVNPELVDRIELYDTQVEPLPLFERYHVHEQLHKALDRKVWLPSGGSIIIERTEALTVIDVNTGKNVGTSNLEETVFRNNLEAAEEIARQLRLRDIGGIIVIDFIDMEIRENRDSVGSALRSALARDKTRAQVYEISELGLVEMTRKRVSEGLVESLSTTCTVCGGRGIMLDESLL
jgi:ribonuclease E